MLWNAALFSFLESIGSSAFPLRCKCDPARWDKRRQEDGVKWDPLYWPPRAELPRFCSGTGNGGAASGARSQNTHWIFFFHIFFSQGRITHFLNKTILFSCRRSSLGTSQDDPEALSHKKMCLCDTNRETLTTNSVDWHRRRVVSVHMEVEADLKTV